jgi:hypothetical protein
MKNLILTKIKKYGKKGLLMYACWLIFKWTLFYFFGKELYAYFVQ